MKIRVIALFMCIGMILSLVGCVYVPSPYGDNDTTENTGITVSTEETYEGYDLVDKSAFDFDHEDYEAVTLNMGYESLTEEAERSLYDMIDKHIYHIAETTGRATYNTLPITLQDTYLSEAQIRLVISAYFIDNPEVFWIDNSFEYSNSSKKTVIQLSSYLSAASITGEAERMSAAIRELYEDIDGGLSAYQRELYAHDKLISHCVYEEDVENISDNFRAFTSLGAIVDSLAVCEGYSRSMQLLLSGLGIESYYILGRGSEELHMWNCVELEGEWYYVDATWDDNSEDGVIYDYFNITEEQLLYDHSINPTYWELTEAEVCGTDGGDAYSFNVFVPRCTDESMSYYSKNAVTVDGFYYDNTERIADAIEDAAMSGDDRIYLYIDEDYLDYDYAVSNLFYSGDYAFFDCIDSANAELYGVSVDRDGVSIQKAPNLSVVTVYLQYE